VFLLCCFYYYFPYYSYTSLNFHIPFPYAIPFYIGKDCVVGFLESPKGCKSLKKGTLKARVPKCSHCGASVMQACGLVLEQPPSTSTDGGEAEEGSEVKQSKSSLRAMIKAVEVASKYSDTYLNNLLTT
jgi:hypothetical protein